MEYTLFAVTAPGVEGITAREVRASPPTPSPSPLSRLTSSGEGGGVRPAASNTKAPSATCIAPTSIYEQPAEC